MLEEASWKTKLEKYYKIVPDFNLEPKSTALVIIDMQYVNAHPDYGLGLILRENYPEVASYYHARLTDTVIPRQIKLIEFFRRKGLKIIYLTTGPLLPDGSDSLFLLSRTKENFRKSLLFPQGTFEHKILEEIKPQAGELVINKTSAGAFNSTAIDQTLRNIGIDGLVFTGVFTNVCVETTARDAADRGYKCVLSEDASAAQSQELHDATLRSFAMVFGQVNTSQGIIEYLQKRLAINSR